MAATVRIALACSLALCAVSLAANRSSTTTPSSGEGFSALLAKGNFAGIQKLLDAPLSSMSVAGLSREDVKAGIARRELIRACGAEALAALSQREGGAALLKDFVSDLAWIESFLISGSPKQSYAQAIENLRLLHRYGKELKDPIYRRLATAMALAAGKMNNAQLVERYGQIQQAHREGLLHTGFDTLSVRQMRSAIWLGGNFADYEYLVHHRQTKPAPVAAAPAGNAPAKPAEGPWSHDALRHGYPGWMAARAAKCGCAGNYATVVAQARGIPTPDAGPPIPCAHQAPDIAPQPLAANGAASPKNSASQGSEGTVNSAFGRLDAIVEEDAASLLDSYRAIWLARLQVERFRSAAEWNATFEKAVSIQPLNYDTWIAWAQALGTSKNVTPEARLKIASRAAQSLAGYPAAAWAVIQRFADNSLNQLVEFERFNFLTECHRELLEEKAVAYEDWPFEDMLKWQANQLGKPDLELDYYGKLLEIHGANPARRSVLTRLLAWGKDYYAPNPKTGPLYVQAMGAYFAKSGAGADPVLMRKHITDGLLTSSNAHDLLSFRLWSDMANTALPPVTPPDVFLSGQQSQEFPKLDPYPGELLSANALLRAGIGSQYDRPLTRPAILKADGIGGFLDLAAQDAPCAVVQLQSDADLSGIILVDRFELPQEAEWALPLSVSLSIDGTSWSQAASFEAVPPQAIYRVEFKEQQPRARFVKIERLPGRKDRFHLRKILVFGKPAS